MDQDQSAAVALLLDPATHRGVAPRRIDTHGAVVALAGERVYKLKRAVRFPFLDYSTPELRRRSCAKELQVNRRTAPDLYLSVRPILREPGGRLALGPAGSGEAQPGAVDWVVEMRRFPDDALLDQAAVAGRLDEATILALADAVARFHAEAERRPDQGGHAAMRRIVADMLGELDKAAGALDPAEIERLREGLAARLDRGAALLDRRRDAGFVRHGHGDLHLGNICLWQGKPTPFDAIEFDDRIACGDVLYDLAFLLMDLAHRDLRPLANAAFNRYMARTLAMADPVAAVEGLALLPLFLACRAGIRAQVTLAAARAQPDADAVAAKEAEARSYLGLALRCLDPPPPRLIAIGGLSGTGKSTLAHGLAPTVGALPGALVLRSDALRKSQAGADLFARLPPEAYGRGHTERVFQALKDCAVACLAAGHAAIADAVYLEAAQRRAIEDAARAARAPFHGLWLEAPAGVLERRVASRCGDMSDAGVDIVRLQQSRAIGALDWTRIDAGGSPQTVLAAARAVVDRA